MADDDECSDVCTRNICEWCPEADREAALIDTWKAEMESMTLAELLALDFNDRDTSDGAR